MKDVMSVVTTQSSVYYRWHADRYLASMRFMEPYLKPHMTVLDVGGGPGFVQGLVDLYRKSIWVDSVPGDLRQPWRACRRKYDLIISWEVLEHLNDRPVPGMPELSRRCFTTAACGTSSLRRATFCTPVGASLSPRPTQTATLPSTPRFKRGSNTCSAIMSVS